MTSETRACYCGAFTIVRIDDPEVMATGHNGPQWAEIQFQRQGWVGKKCAKCAKGGAS